jgi:hypothetical protein
MTTTARVIICMCGWLLLLGVQGDVMNRVLLTQYITTMGARCLDGSAPSYYFLPGTVNKWVIFFQGGGWCWNPSHCLGRANSPLGRSGPPTMDPVYEGGRSILSQNPSLNPEFHNWNLVYIQYCDGGSYAGNVTDPVYAPGSATPIYFRGFQNYLAVMDHLLTQQSLATSSEALLTGCSAGGLAVYHHCNRFAKQMEPVLNLLSAFPSWNHRFE